MIDGDSTVFGVAAQTGEIKTLSAVTKSKKKLFELVVMAIDEEDPTLNDNITLKVTLCKIEINCCRTVDFLLTDANQRSV